MNTDLRDRAVLPLLIPLAAIVLTEIIVFCMSRVLLVAGKTPATVIALAAALAILIGATFIAGRPRISTGAVAGVMGLLVVGSIAAGAWALTQQPFYEREAEASKPRIEVEANNLAFDTDELELAPAGAVIAFNNPDSQPHNIAIYEGEDATGQVLFKGDIVPAAGSTTYDVGTTPVGEHYFQCDVHPSMNGTAVVSEDAAHGEGEGAEGGAEEGEAEEA